MTAKDMFEKLGYKLMQNDVNYLIYNFEDAFEIRFYKPQQQIEICYENLFYGTLNLEELQAINKQVEELGWNDD